MPIGISSNPYVTTQAFPGAAEKGAMDQRQLEKRANAQVESQPTQDTTAVPTRRKPVQAKNDDAQARLEQDNASAEEQKQLIEGGLTRQMLKGDHINIYA